MALDGHGDGDGDGETLAQRVGRLVLPRQTTTPARAIGVRLGIAVACVVVTTVVVYAERDGYSNAADGPLTWLDALYYATVTLSTTGYGDITPLSPVARLTNIVLITPLRFLFLIVLVGTTLEVLTQRTRYEWRARRWSRTVADHTVVIGYGVKGRSAARALLDAGVPADRVVVIAYDEASTREASEAGLTAIQGDARREAVLRQAGITRAARVVIATDQDATSVLVTMLVRRLAPGATIVSAARETANAQFLRESGADSVIVTAEAVGRLLSLSLVSPSAGTLMEDLLESGRGLELVERPVTSEDLGTTPRELERRGELVVAVVRGDEVHRFDDKELRAFNRGDRIVVIRSATWPEALTSPKGSRQE